MIRLKQLLTESVSINGVTLKPKNTETGGPILATYAGKTYTYSIHVDTMLYKGKVGVVAIWESKKNPGTYWMKDNTDKVFEIKRTNLYKIIENIRQQKSDTITVTAMGADITLNKV
jgi:hypothetical protein